MLFRVTYLFLKNDKAEWNILLLSKMVKGVQSFVLVSAFIFLCETSSKLLSLIVGKFTFLQISEQAAMRTFMPNCCVEKVPWWFRKAMKTDMNMTPAAQYTACSYVISEPGSQYASIILSTTGWNGLYQRASLNAFRFLYTYNHVTIFSDTYYISVQRFLSGGRECGLFLM